MSPRGRSNSGKVSCSDRTFAFIGRARIRLARSQAGRDRSGDVGMPCLGEIQGRDRYR
jgi:hypothetical protein